MIPLGSEAIFLEFDGSRVSSMYLARFYLLHISWEPGNYLTFKADGVRIMFLSPWHGMAACSNGGTRRGADRAGTLGENTRLGDGNARGGSHEDDRVLDSESVVVFRMWMEDVL